MQKRHIRNLLLVAVIAALLSGCVAGPQPGPTALPLRPTEAADFEVADIRELMDEMVDAGAPAVFVEVRDGDQVWSSAEGVRSTVTELPARPGDSVRIASLTKPMTATILLQLVAEGEAELDDPIEDYLPGVVQGRDVTIRQLLNHTSGMPDYVPALALDPSEISAQIVTPISHEELVELSRTQEWSFDPGTGYEYSNTNYIVLSMLIEELTGSTMAEQLAERIAEPLGLEHTSIPTGTGMGEHAASGYVIEGPLSIDVTEQDASLWSGAGGVVSTVSDVNTFMRALLSGQLLPPPLLGEMLVLVPEGYGLGVQSRTDTCSDGDPAYLELSPGEEPGEGEEGAGGDAEGADAAEEQDAPEGEEPDDAPRATVFGLEEPEEGSGSVHDTEYGELVQIGEGDHVYGHLGSGLGYRALTMSSPDGMRQVTIAWTVSPTDYGADPRLDIAYELSEIALARDC
ncbi:serine hydrolase [Gulosibacter sp. 10]|uniref:serine hydrolase domain-containing protein n=1 Tax=Gulosibacter sp. 10 TaxID=1255570 RepID=UPI00097F42D1|nr:serine hydrolase domain-containing protein [Gulosibacter sp. 10]SJM68000.1 D-alanyl-D-alanine carboxypeptidase [Gulosibacter sp. 10]